MSWVRVDVACGHGDGIDGGVAGVRRVTRDEGRETREEVVWWVVVGSGDDVGCTKRMIRAVLCSFDMVEMVLEMGGICAKRWWDGYYRCLAMLMGKDYLYSHQGFAAAAQW